MGKGRRERVLPLWKETATAIKRWLAVRHQNGDPELFHNASGRAMTRSGFEYILTKHVATAAGKQPSIGKKHVTPHVLRHYLPYRTMSSSFERNGTYLRSLEIFRRSAWTTRHSQLGLQAVQEPQQIVVGAEAG